MALPAILAEITQQPNPKRRHRSCPRAVKRARHNNYPLKKPDQPASTRHPGPATIRFWPVTPRSPTNCQAPDLMEAGLSGVREVGEGF